MAHLTNAERLASTPLLSALAGPSVVKLRKLPDGRLVLTSTLIGTRRAEIVGGPYTPKMRAMAITNFHRVVKARTPRRTFVYDTASTAEQPPATRH
ncbi:hypothetical protein ASE60_24735 [Ensifer sp. Root278]|nr:hypothetical protein ASE60_24735 [Ensifer sp. Root278]